jgi:predicted nucleotidyltransferase
MALVNAYRAARRDEDVARLRRVTALRAMMSTGMSQREIAKALGLSQSAVSQQLKVHPLPGEVEPQALLEAAAPVLKSLAESQSFTRLAVFGSLARGQAGPDSDIHLLVKTPPGTSSFGFVRFKQMIEHTLGRQVDLAPYGGLTSTLDDDIRREAVPR